MKNSKEMADRVLEIRDAYLEKQKKRRKIIEKVTYVCSTIWAFTLIIVGVHLVNESNYYVPRNNFEDNSAVLSTTSVEKSENYITTKNDAVCTTKSNQDNIITTMVMEKIEESTSISIYEESISSEQIIPQITDDYIDTYIIETVATTESSTECTDNGTIGEIENIESEVKTFENYSLNDIYNIFPSILYEKEYLCYKETVDESQLQLAMDDIVIYGYDNLAQEEVSADIIIYCFQGSDENNEIAVCFNGRNDYIIYKSAE